MPFRPDLSFFEEDDVDDFRFGSSPDSLSFSRCGGGGGGGGSFSPGSDSSPHEENTSLDVPGELERMPSGGGVKVLADPRLLP